MDIKNYNGYLQNRSRLKRWLDGLLYRFGYIRREELDFARNVWKRLDEQRETVNEIAEYSDIFEKRPWVLWHMLTQEEFLGFLFRLRYGEGEEASRLSACLRNLNVKRP